jgi:mannosyltransferase OCH1-like enzyme
MMPPILHQVWVGENPIPSQEKLFCNKLRDMHPSWEYRRWTNAMVDAEQLPSALRRRYDAFYAQKKYAFCADLIRMWVVYNYGGIYLDVDFDMIKPLNDFLTFNGMFMYHEDPQYGEIPNGVFGATVYHPILKYCIENIQEGNHWFGPSWFGEHVKKSVGLSFKEPRETVRAAFDRLHISNPCWETWHNVYAKHIALYSWSDLYEPKP